MLDRGTVACLIIDSTLPQLLAFLSMFRFTFKHLQSKVSVVVGNDCRLWVVWSNQQIVGFLLSMDTLGQLHSFSVR